MLILSIPKPKPLWATLSSFSLLTCELRRARSTKPAIPRTFKAAAQLSSPLQGERPVFMCKGWATASSASRSLVCPCPIATIAGNQLSADSVSSLVQMDPVAKPLAQPRPGSFNCLAVLPANCNGTPESQQVCSRRPIQLMVWLLGFHASLRGVLPTHRRIFVHRISPITCLA